MYRLFTAITLGAFFLLSSLPLHAEETEDIIKGESLGTLSTTREGSLGSDLWKNTKRSFLLHALGALSPKSPSPALHDLKKRILLTTIDAGQIKNDVGPKAGKDLLTLRLSKLNEMGAFEDALTLYSKIEKPYHPALAEEGMKSMLGSFKFSLACLEIKALGRKENTSSFEKELNVFCFYLLSKESEKKAEINKHYPLLQKIFTDTGFLYTPDGFNRFNKKSLIEKIALIGQKKIDFSKIEGDKVAQASPETLITLLSYEGLPGRLKIPLSVEAVRTGLKPSSFLTTIYGEFSEKIKEDVLIEETEDFLKKWQKLPYIHARLKEKNVDKDESIQRIKKMAKLEELYGLTALYPFSSYLTTSALFTISKNKETKDDTVKTLLRLLILSENSGKEEWLALLDNRSFPTFLLVSRFINKNISQTLYKKNTEKEIESLFINADPKIRDTIIFFASMLDKKSLFIHNSPEAYEKQIGLTMKGNYVMPTLGLRNSLAQAKEKKHLGEIVLLSILTFQHAHPEYVYPGLFEDVLGGLKNVGLNREVQSLVKETMIELSK